MRESFKGCGQHVEQRAILTDAKNFRRHVMRCACVSTSNRVENFLQAVFVMLNDLLRPMAMVLEHSPMRWEHQINIEVLHFLLGVEKILEGIVRTEIIYTDVRRNLRQQMITNNEDFVLRQIETAMPSGVPRRPDHYDFTVPNA